MVNISDTPIADIADGRVTSPSGTPSPLSRGTNVLSRYGVATLHIDTRGQSQDYFDDLMQKRSNSNVLTVVMELCLFCLKPAICNLPNSF